jgi:shikimate kinase
LLRCSRSLTISTIILIGPLCAGKSSTSRLLAERLGIERYELDELRWDYYREIGYDEETASMLENGPEGLPGLSRYWKPFEAHAVERVLSDYKNCVIDFGAGHSVYEDEALFARVQQALSPFEHVILLLPSPDLDDSIAIVNSRLSRLLEQVAGKVNPVALQLNETFVKHPSNQRLAKMTIYTLDRTPEEVCNEIVQKIGDFGKNG